MRSLESFQAFAQRYAQTMARGGVNVTFGGTLAYTDGKHINLPAHPSGTLISLHQENVYHGYLDHEIGHIRHTDFGTIVLDRKKDPLGAYLRNLIEDVRIENAQIEDYPGTRFYLDTLCREIDRLSADDLTEKQKDTDPGVKALQLLYKYLFSTFRDIDSGYIQGTLGGTAAERKIKRLVDSRFPKVRTTADAVALADDIKKLLPNTLAPPPREGEPEDVELSGKELLQALATLAAAADLIDLHEKRGELIVLINGQITASNAALEAGPVKGRAKQDWSGKSVLPPLNASQDRILAHPGDKLAAYEKTKAKVSAEILAAQKMLRLFLQSRAQRAWSRGLEEGRLDTTQVHRLLTSGDRKIMKEKRSRTFLNTATALTLDLSGSMDQETLRLTSVVLTEALSGIPEVRLEITGWRTEGYARDTQGQIVYKKEGVGRGNIVNYFLFKDFDQPVKQARGRLGALTTSGGTPLGDGFALTMARLAKRKEARKVMILVSDGDPAYASCDPKHSDELFIERTARKCRTLGIETLGLFVGREGSELLKKNMDYYVHIDSISKLPTTIMQIIRERIAA